MNQTKWHKQLNCQIHPQYLMAYSSRQKQQDFPDGDLFHFLYFSYSGKYPNMEITLNLAQLLKIGV